MRGEIFTLLLATWPCLQALFIVKSEQDSYDGELREAVRMGCRFSDIPSVLHISVIWQRIKPPPEVEVFRLDKGVENLNITSKQFQGRVRLLREELEKFRAVIELSQLRLNDSGTYQCLVIHDEADYKQTKLTVSAPYKAIKKSVRRLNEKEVELSCQSQGLPLADVTWSDGKLREPLLTNRSKSSHTTNSDGVFVVTSRLSVSENTNNYSCSYITNDGKPNQIATFVIPDEIPEESKGATGYIAITVIVLLCLGLFCTFLILRKRKKGQTGSDMRSIECESPGEDLTVPLTDRKENQHVSMQSVPPGLRKIVLLEGKEGTGKTFITQSLASSWANPFTSDLLNIRKVKLVIFVTIGGVAGDFFEVVKSRFPAEAELQTNNLKDILLGNKDSLLILDGYKEGDRELDKSFVKFLRERRACRVLITACPGEHGILGETDRKVLRL
ncbi:programmed cell death 1 ligand 1 [Silurus meridionalis]|uniref:programmed cell death 1 ligand 1 n=1 Tax=Silurus meridionalis TaxID=175797 RepID=UPI001EEBBD92|nr:programmed cell death 1 ligand 1 [Silurus meridionalis]